MERLVEIAWSPDGKFLLFDTSQRSEQAQIARVDLLPHVPKYREDEFRELFRRIEDARGLRRQADGDSAGLGGEDDASRP